MLLLDLIRRESSDPSLEDQQDADIREDDAGEEALLERMVENMGLVDERELTDPAEHARRCGPRFQLQAAISLDARRRSKNNTTRLRRLSRQVERVERKVLWTMIGCTGVVGGLQVLGPTRGQELIWRVVERLLG